MRTSKKRAASVVAQSVRTKYEILKVQPSATQGEIKRSYTRLLLNLHPDRLQSNIQARNRHVQCAFAGEQSAQGCAICLCTLQFAEVTEAYATIGDAVRRAAYDAELRLRGRQCYLCKGSGRVRHMGRRFSTVQTTCRRCGGTGMENINESFKL